MSMFADIKFRLRETPNNKYVVECMLPKSTFRKEKWVPFITATGLDCAWEYSTRDSAIKETNRLITEELSKVVRSLITVSKCCESGFFHHAHKVYCWECRDECDLISIENQEK